MIEYGKNLDFDKVYDFLENLLSEIMSLPLQERNVALMYYAEMLKNFALLSYILKLDKDRLEELLKKLQYVNGGVV